MKSRTSRTFHPLRSFVGSSVAIALLASGSLVLAGGVANAASLDGSGTMTTPTQSVSYGSTGNTIVFTYTAATGGALLGEVDLTVPSGWSAPSTTTKSAGYTVSTVGTVGVSGSTIKVTGVTLTTGKSFSITYGATKGNSPGATATSTIGAATWTTLEKSTSTGTLRAIAASPSISVIAGSAKLATPAAPIVSVASPTSINVAFKPNPNAVSSTITLYQAQGHSVVKVITGNTTGSAVIVGLTAGKGYYVTITSIGNGTTSITSAEGASSATVTPGELTLTVANKTIVAGAAVNMNTIVSGLASSDQATATAVTYTYSGKGSTTYGTSTTAPKSVGTYAVKASGATVTVTPAVDQSTYSKNYNYVAGTLTIVARPKVVPHAVRVVGTAVAGRTVLVTIVGTGFFGQPRIVSSTGRATTAVVTRDTGKALTVRVTVKAGTPIGTHVFKIIFSNGLFTNVHYNQR
jgi:hypothetical protein